MPRKFVVVDDVFFYFSVVVAAVAAVVVVFDVDATAVVVVVVVVVVICGCCCCCWCLWLRLSFAAVDMLFLCSLLCSLCAIATGTFVVNDVAVHVDVPHVDATLRSCPHSSPLPILFSVCRKRCCPS